jgi:hypothetical protein
MTSRSASRVFSRCTCAEVRVEEAGDEEVWADVAWGLTRSREVADWTASVLNRILCISTPHYSSATIGAVSSLDDGN